MPKVERKERGSTGRPHVLVAMALACVALAACGGTSTEPAEAADAGRYEQAAAPEALSQALVGLGADYVRASPDTRGRALTDLFDAAAQRHDVLAGLIEDEPGTVLRAALPPAVGAGMPEEVQAHLERHVDLEGELEVVYEDYPDGSARLRHFLKIDGERISLHFEADPPGLLSGTRVRASGVRLDDAMALESARSILTLGADGGTVSVGTPAPVPNTFGEQKTLLLLVNFQDQPAEPYTVEHARNLVFGTVSDFFRENSYGQTWLSGDVYGWFTIALSSSVCDGNTLAAQANGAAQAAGVDLSAYAHVVYAFQNACGGRGFGTVGGNPSQSWISGELRADVVAHELGHGLGLWHSHSRDCGTVALGPTCNVFEYGHPIDTMGNANFGHFNAFHKERLGWLNFGGSPAIATAATDGTYVLDAYGLAGSGPKALKILKSTDPTTGCRTWYYVEARKALGFDGFLASNGNVLGGVLVSTGSESAGNTSYLLDMTPSSGTLNGLDWSDPALVVGRSFQDPDTGVTITTQWVTSTQAAVSVQVGSGTVQPAQPTVTVATDQSSYTRSQTVTITARVTGQGAAVAGAAVSFRVNKPNGAVITGSGTTGSDGTVAYKLRLKRQDPVGSYQASATMTSSAPPPSATTTFAVQ